MSSVENSKQETNSKKPDDDLESEETLSLCDFVVYNKNNSTDDNYQCFSKEEEDLFEFFTGLDTNAKSITSYSPEKIIFGGKLVSFEGKQKSKNLKENPAKRKLEKYDSVGSSSSKRHTNLLLILLGIPPKTQTEKEIMVGLRNRQNQQGPSTFFQSDRGNDKKLVRYPRVKKGFWRALSVVSCFGG